MSISIIIPVYREGDGINALITHLRRLDTRGDAEIVVVDGHPDRDTISVIRDKDVVALGSAKGRARQMNAGAVVARGSLLLFLHADTWPPPGALSSIKGTLEDERLVGGAFDLRFDTKRRRMRLFARFDSLRARMSRIPFGDQAIFLRRSYFDLIGGFADILIMEDVDIMRRIKRRGDVIAIVDNPVTTSSRRFDREGLFYCLVRGGVLLTLFYLGVPPARLKRFYKDRFRTSPQACAADRPGARDRTVDTRNTSSP